MAEQKTGGAATPSQEMYLVLKTFYDAGGRLVKPGTLYPWTVSEDNPLPAVLGEAPKAPKAEKKD